MKLTNRWNRFVYRLWAPVYDATVNRVFMPGRRRAMQVLGLQPGDSVLLVGVGTGADLPLLPPGVRAVGIDLSPEMLAKARAKLPLPGREVSLLQGDAQDMRPEPASYDAAVLNLILSVVPDGAACLRATLPALKPVGRVVIFDKFLPDHDRPSRLRRGLNLFSMVFGTDINRRLGDLLAGTGWCAVQDEPSLLRGTYRVILLKRAG